MYINQTGIKDSNFGDNAKILINQQINVPKKNQPIPSNVRQGSKNFVGREKDLEEIHAKLQMGQGVFVCTVEGMGGVGKTELALKYAKAYKTDYVEQYWLSLRAMSLAQAILHMANTYLALPEGLQSLDLETQAEWCWQNWLPDTGNLLVILDDVPSVDSIPERTMPMNDRIKVLLTTRERSLNLNFVPISLKVLPMENALQLLEKIVGVAKVQREQQTAEQICKSLGQLPLGVELVGEYLAKNRHLTFAKLQEKLNLTHESIAKDRQSKLYGNLGVAAAIQLTWNDLNISAQRVAMFLGLFAPVDLWWELIRLVAMKAEINEDELETARGELDRMHLIEPVNGDCDIYNIHPLVREYFRLHLSKSEVSQLFRNAFVDSFLDIAKLMPRTITQDQSSRFTFAIPHLEIISREMLDDITNHEEDLIWVFTGIASFYKAQGQYTLAMPSLQNCLKVIEVRLGTDHPHFASSLNNLAELYLAQGQYGEVEMLYLQSLEIKEKQLGFDHPFVANSLNNLALFYKSQEKYNEAEPLYLRALLIRKRQLGNDHPLVADSLNNLAGLYQAQREDEKAITLYKQSLEIHKNASGERHPDVATVLNNLAETYRVQENYSEAESLYLRALEIREEQLGDNHPDIASSLFNLAVLYHKDKDKVQRHSEALNLIQRAIQIYKQTLGVKHPTTQAAQSWLPPIRSVFDAVL